MAALRPVDGEFVMSAWTVPKKGAGRRAQKDHVECRYVVHALLTAFCRVGRKLNFDRNQNRGSLLEAFLVLAPYLPPRVVADKSARLLADVNQNWPRLVSVAKLVDFEWERGSYADFVGITVVPCG
jgi:hypothetical protein